MSQIAEEHMLQQVNMEMDDVELISSGADFIEHDEMAGNVIANAGKSEPFRNTGHELCGRC